MGVFVVGTDAVASNETLTEYLQTVADEGDTMYVVNSLVGGDDTSEADVDAGEDAVQSLADSLADLPVTVETRQFVRGNPPEEDMLTFAEEVDADEFVIGVRERTPVGKATFGSTAQNLLLNADRPVRCVPLVE